MATTPPKNRRRQRGQALVESALIFVVFFAFVIGLLDIGQMMFLHQTLVERARNAARWGAINAYDQVSIQNLVLYGKTSPAFTDRPFWNLSASNVTVNNPGCGPTPKIDCRITVVVSGYSYTMFSAPLISLFQGGHAQGRVTGLSIEVSMPSEVPNTVG
jgi:hypothetical protein